MKKQFLEAGQIVSTHGVRGEVKVMPWADGPEFLLDFDTVYLDGKPLAVQSARVQKTCVLMKLEGVDSIETASVLRDKVLSVNRADVELEEGAVFIADLIGLPVLADGEQIGTVADILQRPGNDVYIVTDGKHEYLIPAVPEFILERNTEAGFVRVKLIEGMRSDEI